MLLLICQTMLDGNSQEVPGDEFENYLLLMYLSKCDIKLTRLKALYCQINHPMTTDDSKHLDLTDFTISLSSLHMNN